LQNISLKSLETLNFQKKFDFYQVFKNLNKEALKLSLLVERHFGHGARVLSRID